MKTLQLDAKIRLTVNVEDDVDAKKAIKILEAGICTLTFGGEYVGDVYVKVTEIVSLVMRGK